MRILVLDDSISRLEKFKEWIAEHELVIAVNVEDALSALKNQAFDLVFLDHDLGYDVPTGSVLTRKWRHDNKEYATQKATVVVHTSSEAGANLMISDLRLINAEIIRKPFYSLSAIFIRSIIGKLSK